MADEQDLGNPEHDKIIPVNIEEQMKTAYIDYSMSVIVGRALPDVRDGLKPVHRRVLYGMSELGNTYNKAHKKSARIVGEVLGKYHPHGDSSVYDTMVRMAQPWSLRYMLIDGQGNFGSVDGDSPAAMRYTEVRLSKIADAILNDLDKETVDFQNNFDDTLKEPTVMPTKLPHLIINGASGIAVGMATNMLPHNLSEACDAIAAYIGNPEITTAEIMQHIKAPDFPTGGTIYGVEGVKQAFETGRGKVVVRGKYNVVEDKKGKEQIIIYELPYQVNKANLHQKIAHLVNDKIIEGVSDVRDESDRNGMRLVVDLKRDAMAQVIVNQLFKYTELQSSYGVNNVALVGGRPRQLSMLDMIREFVNFRLEVIQRRAKYELRKAEERAHILEGYLIALDNLDAIITLIRNSKNPEEAKAGLIADFNLTEIQAKAILEMRLQRLTGMERDKIKAEYDDIMAKIASLKELLATESLQFALILEETADMKEKFGDERRTNIEFSSSDVSIEDLIEEEQVFISVSNLGYIKRTSAAEYRAQRRGGRGARGSRAREEDYISDIFVASTHATLLFFTDSGRVHWLKVHQIPEGDKTAKGRAIQNLLQVQKEDKIRTIINIRNFNDEEFVETHNIVLCTKKGIIKKTKLKDFSRPRSSGVNAITINEGDELLDVAVTDGNSFLMMAKSTGYAIRFPEEKVRATGRGAIGVSGIKIAEGEEVVSMLKINKKDQDAGTKTILVVSEKGLGKRTAYDEYRITNRGGKGVKTINVTEKTGKLAGMLLVEETDNLFITCVSGVTIRMNVTDIREAGRATQGVKLINIDEGDKIAALAKIQADDDDVDQFELDEEGNPVLDDDGNPVAKIATEGEDSESDTTGLAKGEPTVSAPIDKDAIAKIADDEIAHNEANPDDLNEEVDTESKE